MSVRNIRLRSDEQEREGWHGKLVDTTMANQVENTEEIYTYMNMI